MLPHTGLVGYSMFMATSYVSDTTHKNMRRAIGEKALNLLIRKTGKFLVNLKNMNRPTPGEVEEELPNPVSISDLIRAYSQ